MRHCVWAVRWLHARHALFNATTVSTAPRTLSIGLLQCHACCRFCRFVAPCLRMCALNSTLCYQERLPVRMVLRGDMPVRHAFDGDSGVCVVPLRLSLRNCLPQTASLSIEAGLTVEASQRNGALMPSHKIWGALSYCHSFASEASSPPCFIAHLYHPEQTALLLPCCQPAFSHMHEDHPRCRLLWSFQHTRHGSMGSRGVRASGAASGSWRPATGRFGVISDSAARAGAGARLRLVWGDAYQRAAAA